MSPFEKFIPFLNLVITNPWLLVKFLFLIGLLIYTAFAIIVIRQVGLMSRTLEGDFNRWLKLIAWIHLGVVIGIFVLTWVIL